MSFNWVSPPFPPFPGNNPAPVCSSILLCFINWSYSCRICQVEVLSVQCKLGNNAVKLFHSSAIIANRLMSLRDVLGCSSSSAFVIPSTTLSCVYLANILTYFLNFAIREFFRILRDTLTAFSATCIIRLWFTTNSLYVPMYRKPKYYLVHFVNINISSCETFNTICKIVNMLQYRLQRDIT